MIILMGCPLCHKMFFWHFIHDVPIHCPNCESGYEYHRDRRPPKDYLDKIVLEKIDLKELLESEL